MKKGKGNISMYIHSAVFTFIGIYEGLVMQELELMFLCFIISGISRVVIILNELLKNQESTSNEHMKYGP